MAALFAIFAIFVKQEFAIFAIEIIADIANNSKMDIQNEIRLWISSELEKMGHGAKGRLAAHLGVRADAITRMLNTNPTKEMRVIRAEELVKIREFFDSSPPGLESPADSDPEFMALYERAPKGDREAVKAFLKTLSASRNK